MVNNYEAHISLQGEGIKIPEHCILGIASVHTIQKLLLKGSGTRFLQTWEKGPDQLDTHHPLGQWSTLTTRNDPAVIYDDGAGFCTPVIVFDSEGNGIHFHDSLIDKHYRSEKAMNQYFDGLQQYIKQDDIVSCVAGTNVSLTEKDQKAEVNIIDELIKEVRSRVQKGIGDTTFISFVSKQYDNQQRSSSIVPDKTTVLGFMFIPKYESIDGKNHLLAVPYNEAKKIRTTFQIK